MADPVIRVHGVALTYPTGVTALKGVDLDVQPGETVGVVGQNGSGKTTLTKLLNGLLQPTAGWVEVDGVCTTGKRVQRLAPHVGYVFQNPNHQLFAQTVRQELAFGPRNLRLSGDEVDARVLEAAEFFGLGPHLDQHPYRVSFPVRKLVSIAAVFAMRTPIIVLDEPTTGQDHSTTTVINRLLGRLRDQGVTVVCVSHDMQLLAETTERLVVVHAGRIRADAPPRDVFADAALLAETNLRPPQVTDVSLQTTAAHGGRVALRPEDLAADLGQLTETKAKER